MDYDQAQPGSFTRSLPYLTKITDWLTLIVKDIGAGKQPTPLGTPDNISCANRVIANCIVCDRFTASFEFREIKLLFNLQRDSALLRPRYNIAPSQGIPVIVHK